MLMTKAMKEALAEAYEKGRQAGIAERAVEAFEDDKRRLTDVYRWGYQLGAEDAAAKLGVIEIDDLLEQIEGK